MRGFASHTVFGHAIVGEDIILPRGTIHLHFHPLGESVPRLTWYHSTKHAGNLRGGRLIASPTAVGVF